MPSQEVVCETKNAENNINQENIGRKKYRGCRRRKYRPSPIKIVSQEEIEKKCDIDDSNNIKRMSSPERRSNSNSNDIPMKSIHVIPFKPLYPRGVMSPKVSRFIRRNSDYNNTPTRSTSILASPPSARSPIASPGSAFDYENLQIASTLMTPAVPAIFTG